MRMKSFIIFGSLMAIISGGAYAAGENIPTSRAYVDANIATKQGILQKQNSDSVAVTFPTTVGGTPGARTINTSLGSSTSDTALATTGAINTALNGTPGIVKAKPIYSTTDNYKSALVTVGDLNTAIINAVNSGLTQVADGWQINSSETLPTLRSYVSLDPDIDGLGYCFQGLEYGGDGGCTMALYDSLGHMSGRWGVSFEYGDIAGKSVCSATEGTENVVATDA